MYLKATYLNKNGKNRWYLNKLLDSNKDIPSIRITFRHAKKNLIWQLQHSMRIMDLKTIIKDNLTVVSLM